MAIENTLKQLRAQLASTRQVGHSSAMVNGAKNMPSTIILVANMNQKKQFRDFGISNRCVSINSLNSLMGLHAPLAFDNCTLDVLFSDAIKKIKSLEDKLEKARKRIDKLKHESRN